MTGPRTIEGNGIAAKGEEEIGLFGSGEAGLFIAGKRDCEQQFAGQESLAARLVIGQSEPLPIWAMGQPGAHARAAPNAQGRPAKAG